MFTATLWVALGVITAAFITRGVKISEFRQAWIDGLRSDISEYICKAHEWIDLYLISNKETEQVIKSKMVTKLDRLKYDALHIHSRISLRFKPEDKVANDFLANLLNLLDPSKIGLENEAYSNWRDCSDSIVLEARHLLKEEWEATKNPFRKLRKNA
jgi:hypothetical protein